MTTREKFLPRPDALGDVKLIGLGGVGGAVARYGALYLASLDVDTRLVLVDGDVFEYHNASRMLFGGAGDNVNKAEAVKDDLLRYLDGGRLSLEAIGEHVRPHNIDRLIQEGDIVLLAVDNHATRKLVSEFCSSRRNDVCLISGGNDGIGKVSTGRERRGTAGNCQIYVRRDGADLTPTLTAYHGEIDQPRDEAPDDPSCTVLAQQGVPQILFTNLIVASAMLNTLWLYLCGSLHYAEVTFDIAEGLMRPIQLPVPTETASS